MISNSMKSSYFAADDTSDEDSDDDAVVAEVVEHPNTGESTSLNEPTSTEVEPHTQDEPIHDVDMGDVKNASNNGDKDSSSVDDAQIHKADSGGADEDKGNDGDKGSSLTSNKVDTQQEGRKEESSSSCGNGDSDRNRTGKSTPLD